MTPYIYILMILYSSGRTANFHAKSHHRLGFFLQKNKRQSCNCEFYQCTKKLYYIISHLRNHSKKNFRQAYFYRDLSGQKIIKREQILVLFWGGGEGQLFSPNPRSGVGFCREKFLKCHSVQPIQRFKSTKFRDFYVKFMHSTFKTKFWLMSKSLVYIPES